MNCGEVGDVDVVADAGSVRGVVVGAENDDALTSAGCRLTGDLDEVSGVRGGLTGPPRRIGAGDVEVAQRRVAEVVCSRRVAKHPLGRQLGAPVRIHRSGRSLLVHRHLLRSAVDGRGRREDEVLHATGDAGLNQARARDRVVPVVLEGVDDRLGHHGASGEVDYRPDTVIRDERAGRRGVAGIAFHEFRLGGNGRPGPRHEVVEDHHGIPRLEKGQGGVAADVAGASGDQDRSSGRHAAIHTFCMRSNRFIRRTAEPPAATRGSESRSVHRSSTHAFRRIDGRGTPVPVREYRTHAGGGRSLARAAGAPLMPEPLRARIRCMRTHAQLPFALARIRAEPVTKRRQ